MGVTLKTIAERTGLALGTVSQAMRDDPIIAEPTRKRVKAAAESLGYVPSDLGRALQAGRSALIGYFLSDLTQTYYGEIMQGLASAAAENGFGILFVATPHSAETQIQQIKFLEKKRVEGLITSGCEPDTWLYLEKLAAGGFPVVVSENYPPRQMTTVKTDDLAGGAMAAGLLADLGHRRTLYFNPGNAYNLRRDGFQDELRRRGLPSAAECSDADALGKILRGPERPTAIFAYRDLDAMRAREIAASVGLKTPADLSLVGFDDDAYAAFPDISLTTVRPRKQEVGRASVLTLLKMIGNSPRGESRLIKPDLIVRNSVGGPNIKE